MRDRVGEKKDFYLIVESLFISTFSFVHLRLVKISLNESCEAPAAVVVSHDVSAAVVVSHDVSAAVVRKVYDMTSHCSRKCRWWHSCKTRCSCRIDQLNR